MEAAQELLDEGLSRREVAERLGLKKDTLSKAVLAGHLRERKKKQ
jgi:transcriptional regulator with XRE-family HTH domain